MWRHTLIGASAWMLTACASGTQPMPALPRLLPAEYAQECPELPPARSGSDMDLLMNHTEVAELYHICRERHRATVEWIRRQEIAR